MGGEGVWLGSGARLVTIMDQSQSISAGYILVCILDRHQA